MINRQKIHAKYDGRCAYCGQEISLKQMQVDHILPKSIGGSDCYKNLNPSCRLCNHYKRSSTPGKFRLKMRTLHERLEKIYIVRVALRYGIIKLNNFDKFYYEKHT